MTHLEYEWESPLRRPAIQALAKKHTLIRYDARGNGLSDWEVAELSLDAWVSDLETVIDAAEVEHFRLLGGSQGCAISIAYAVRHTCNAPCSLWRLRARPQEALGRGT